MVILFDNKEMVGWLGPIYQGFMDFGILISQFYMEHHTFS